MSAASGSGFKSREGLAATETARNISFCTHAIENTTPLIVTDASADPRFAASPLVLGEPHVRFYIDVPLRSRDGYNVGALCAMDTKVRYLGDEQVSLLQDLACLVVDEMELRLVAATDNLTGAMSRRRFHEEATRDLARCRRNGKALSCAVFDVDHFKSVIDTYGHNVGDAVLHRIVSICKAELRAVDYIGRIGGEEFAIMLPETALGTAFDVVERLRKTLHATAIDVPGQKISVSISVGVATRNEGNDTVGALLDRADAAMYRAKNGGRNRTVRYLKFDAGELLLTPAA